MTRDPRVEMAISNWAPRFVGNGVPLTDFREVTGSIEHWDQWCSAWSARADQHESLGRTAIEEGRLLSAGSHLSTASICHHFGQFMFVHAPDEMRETHMRAVRCRTDAMPLLRPPGEHVRIPFEGTHLHAYLRRPPGVERPGVVVLIGGLDSTKEEMSVREDLFLARGLATFSMDGPGQGESQYDLPIRGDYEVAVTAVIDHLEQRDDVDAGRVGLWGVSLGGYYAPRAAAFEGRVRACLSLAGPYDWSSSWDELPELVREVYRVRSHSESMEEAAEHSRSLSLEGVAERITCPLFVVFGKQDRLISYRDAERLAAEASGETELMMIEDGNHGAANRAHRFRNLTADWMAHHLGGVVA